MCVCSIVLTGCVSLEYEHILSCFSTNIAKQIKNVKSSIWWVEVPLDNLGQFTDDDDTEYD